MQWLSEFAKYCGYFTGIAAFLALVVKPIRESLFGVRDLREAMKCMLRSEMLHIYYKNREKGTIRQYEKENFMFAYKAYKALKGNSFIDDICVEVRKWGVVT